MTEPTLSICKLGMRLNSAEDGQIIANLINYVQRLDILDMRGNTLGVDASEVIANSLANVSTLKCATFSDMFTGRLRTEIPVVLRNLSNAIIAGRNQLKELDLSDNALGPSAIPGIEDFLSSAPCYTLETMRFVNCGLGPAGIIVANRLMLCKQNAERDGVKFQLREFAAGRNRLEDAGARALSAAFKKLGTLRHIELPQNGIREEGIVELAKGIGQCTQLEYLNLNDNTFRATGATAMSRAIRNIEQCLRVVDFGDCLCREGAVDVLEAIADNHGNTITLIDLSGNDLTIEQAKFIIDTATQFPNLQRLSLGTNMYGTEFRTLQQYINDLQANDYIDLGKKSDDQGSDDDANDESDDDEVDIY